MLASSCRGMRLGLLYLGLAEIPLYPLGDLPESEQPLLHRLHEKAILPGTLPQYLSGHIQGHPKLY